MSDFIKITEENHKFQTVAEFEMFGMKQESVVVIDTGCTSSLISIDKLRIKNGIEPAEMKLNEILNYKVFLGIGTGIESHYIGNFNENRDFMEKIHQINMIKLKLQKLEREEEYCRRYLANSIGEELLYKLLENKALRFTYKVKNFKLQRVNLGDLEMRVTYDAHNLALLGMNIIKKLYIRIFSIRDTAYLLAKPNSSNADTELNIAIKNFLRQMELLEGELV